jgi:hemerythrin-like metal-binding protein
VPVFAKGSIMKFCSLPWIARNVSGMMKEARRSMTEQMERLSHTPDDQFADGFNGLVAHIEASFRDEESVMEALNYPALRSHREQHARALSALHHAQPQIEAGDISLGREALELLPKWLLLHRSTMDLALASATRPPVSRARRHHHAGLAGAMSARQIHYPRELARV